mmetsp:Transcript_4047/g.11357  ORF Transcript_4047/g.11357 Transcript_4047/m.11357 type:complete len:386 (-) Transcript_4047:313-1470(-)
MRGGGAPIKRSGGPRRESDLENRSSTLDRAATWQPSSVFNKILNKRRTPVVGVAFAGLLFIAVEHLALLGHQVGASQNVSVDAGDDGFTIVLNTFRRDACLKACVPHWLSCAPRQLRVVWNDVERSVPQFMHDYVRDWNGVLVLDVATGTNLTNRFTPRDFLTDAVFSTDDDTIHPCEELYSAFAVWRRNPSKMVGFAPRLLREQDYVWDQSYHNWGWNQANTLFVTKGGFVHRRFYQAYFSDRFSPLRGIVDGNVTGEDMLISFVHATVLQEEHSAAAPIPIFSHGALELDCDSAYQPLSSRSSANDRRNAMLRDFVAVFGMPFQIAEFGDFHVWDQGLRSFRSMGDRCGWTFRGWHRLMGTNLVWLRCIRQAWIDARSGSYTM